MILIVDDESAIRQLVRSILQSAGYRVREASGSAEALRILEDESSPPQVLLTDIVMPGMNGLALAATVHRMLPEVPVIFMTGFADEYEGELSGSVCLRKPFTIGQLLSAVDDIMSAPPRGSRGTPSIPGT